jgi:glutamate formiminotransferase
VGARKILIACNINLQTADVEIARAIARAIRASSGGLPHVKAMGLLLHSRNLAQVSMNLTDFEQTGVHTVFEAVAAEAARHGVEIAGTEMIGLWPRAALLDASRHFLKLENYRAGGLLEDLLL